MVKKTLVGKKDGCNVFIEWELKDGKFSASGSYMNKLGSDSTSCGQNLDEILEDFPDNESVQSIHQVWKRWHLNDMRAGSPKQMELIRTVIGPAYEKLNSRLSYYDFVTKELEKLGRLRDPDYLIDGVAYKYGSKWLKEEIPAEVVAVINSWTEAKAEETLIQKLAKKYIKNYTTVDRGKIKVTLKSGATFDFHFGSAVNPTPEMMLDALIRDAQYGKDGFEAALEECLDLGYGGKGAIKVAKAFVKNYEKAEKCGLWEEAKDEIN